MSKEYFELAGALLVFYAVFRLILWLEFRAKFRRLTPVEKLSDVHGHPIDTRQLSNRLRNVRGDYAGEAEIKRPSGANRPRLVERRRKEISKLAFFQRPPPDQEPNNPERGGHVFLAL